MTLPPPTVAAPLWRYHFTDARLARLVATLPLSGVTLNEVLSGVADGSGTVPLDAASVRAREAFAATEERRSVCWAERLTLDAAGLPARSDLMWSGIVMTRVRKLAAAAMPLGMVTWEGYLKRRRVPDLTFTQVDAFTVVRTLVRAAALQPATPHYGNSPHLVDLENLSGPLSGVLVDRTYLASDRKEVLEAVDELATAVGFDWRLTPYAAVPGDLNTFRVRLDLGYPRLGREEPPDLHWSSDPADARQRWGHILDVSLSGDGTEVDNFLMGLGQGSGPLQLRCDASSSYTPRDEMAAGYLAYEGEAGSATNDARDQDELNRLTYGEMAARFASETTLSGIQVRGDLPPLVTSYGLGDDLTLHIGDTLTGVPTTVVGQLVGRQIKPPEATSNEEVVMDVQGRAV